jgi:C1A family cysteine protease
MLILFSDKMASAKSEPLGFQTPIKKKCSSPSLSSPSSISTTSTNPKQRSITDDSNTNDETITTIKMEDGTDEVKIFSASTIKKNEVDDDIDVDGIEDRLSPVIQEPVS